MKNLLRSVAALIVGVTVSQIANADVVVQMRPNLDNTIYSESNNSNGKSISLFVGLTQNNDIRRALVQFDVASNIPSNATITAATLTVTLTKVGAAAGGTADYELRPLLSSWGEGTSNGGVNSGGGVAATTNDSTWNHRFYSTSSWTTAGGDFGASSAVANIGNNVLGTYSFVSTPELVANVQGWVNTPASNHGWIFKDLTETGVTARQFASREGAFSQQPVLTVSYVTVPEPTSAFLLGIGLLMTTSRGARKVIVR